MLQMLITVLLAVHVGFLPGLYFAASVSSYCMRTVGGPPVCIDSTLHQQRPWLMPPYCTSALCSHQRPSSLQALLIVSLLRLSSKLC